ncbi:MAG: alpha/beta hydrolase-fold protein [Solirubrobacteraceae bacterium]
MRRGRELTATLVAVAVLILVGGAAVVVARRSSKPRRPSGSAASSAVRTVSIVCSSPALGGTLPAQVYLPPGYSQHGRRYPVIYFLHGLPAGPASYKTNAFVAGALATTGKQAIVVAPQGARNSNSDREYLNWSPTENWPQAIAHDLPTCIDRHYPTIADRYGRALTGISAGGYGAANIGLRHLATFAAVESWSGYFAATDPTGAHVLDLGSAQADRAAAVPSAAQLLAELKAWPSLIAFYVGRQDSRFLQMNEQFATELTEGGVAHTFATYPGGHSPTLWRAQAPRWLTLAVDDMAAGQRHRGPH